jgi:ABC-2 type transport system permease protein
MKVFAKYAAFARTAAAQAAGERSELYGRMAFLLVILGVFSALWRAVAEAGMPIGLDASDLVWYLATTEWILLSPPPVHVDMEGEIRRGDVAYQLARPFSYLTAVTAQGLGMMAVRAPVLALTGFACALIVTGRVPDGWVFAFTVPFGVVAMVLIYGLYVVNGLTAFWLEDVSPLFWVWQKLLFILGGLMLPLSFYPDWMQQLARYTPFASLLAGPASFVMAGSAEGAWRLTQALAFWTVVIVLSARLLFDRAVRTLQLNGG